jgi:hypothetical protein
LSMESVPEVFGQPLRDAPPQPITIKPRPDTSFYNFCFHFSTRLFLRGK